MQLTQLASEGESEREHVRRTPKMSDVLNFANNGQRRGHVGSVENNHVTWVKTGRSSTTNNVI